MNKRIKELMPRPDLVQDSAVPLNFYSEIQMEEFAELIVEECAKISEDASIQKIPASAYATLIRHFEREPFTTYFDEISARTAARFVEEYKHRWQHLPEDQYESITQAINGLKPVDDGYGTHCYNYVYEIGDKLYDFIFEFADKTNTPAIMWKMKKV
jgi:hypothetical protein